MDIRGTPQRQLAREPGFDWGEYELHYWRATGMMVGGDKNLRYLKVFESPKRFSGSVVDMGSGPFGGVLPYLDAERKIAVEPLYERYCAEGLWKGGPEIEVCPEFAEDTGLDTDSVDAIFACNSLDHGESIQDALSEVARILKPEGQFFLHVHCRKRKQLNEGHRQAFGAGDLLVMARRAGLVSTHWDLYRSDPVNRKYRTFVGRFTKRASTFTPGLWNRACLRMGAWMRRTRTST